MKTFKPGDRVRMIEYKNHIGTVIATPHKWTADLCKSHTPTFYDGEDYFIATPTEKLELIEQPEQAEPEVIAERIIGCSPRRLLIDGRVEYEGASLEWHPETSTPLVWLGEFAAKQYRRAERYKTALEVISRRHGSCVCQDCVVAQEALRRSDDE